MTSTDEAAGPKVPGLLEVLARVPDPRERRGRSYLLAFVLAVAVACALAGARNFREAGDHATDLPQDVLARLGGTPHPLLGRIAAPSETRIRTLIQVSGADLLDDLIGGWLRAQADAGRLDGLLTAIAIDGKWLRGVLDGQVKLFSADAPPAKGDHRAGPGPGRHHRGHPGEGPAQRRGASRGGGHRRRRPLLPGDRAVHRREGRGRLRYATATTMLPGFTPGYFESLIDHEELIDD